jgi:DNA gyrase/topoisomerase IV subunit B
MSQPSVPEPHPFDPNSIKTLTFCESVRTRPHMYIASLDGDGLHHLLYFAVDSLIAHYQYVGCALEQITVHLEDDGSATVTSQGQASEAFLQRSAGLLERELWGASMGYLGTVNALSARFIAGARGPQNRWYEVTCKEGVPQQDGLSERAVDEADKDKDIELHFWPDFTILEPGSFDYDRAVDKLRPLLDIAPTVTIAIIASHMEAE